MKKIDKLIKKITIIFLLQTFYDKEDGESFDPQTFERLMRGEEHLFDSETHEITIKTYNEMIEQLDDEEAGDIRETIEHMRQCVVNRPAVSPLPPLNSSLVDEMVTGDAVMAGFLNLFKKSYVNLQRTYDSHMLVMEQVIRALIVRKKILKVFFLLIKTSYTFNLIDHVFVNN